MNRPKITTFEFNNGLYSSGVCFNTIHPKGSRVNSVCNTDIHQFEDGHYNIWATCIVDTPDGGSKFSALFALDVHPDIPRSISN